MPRSGAFLEAVISFYSNLAFDALRTMHATQEDIRTGRFSGEKMLANVLNLSLEATEGWFSALLVSGSQPLPAAFLRIPPKANTGAAEVNVLVDGNPQLEGLQRVGGGGTIDKGRVDLQITKDQISLNPSRTGLRLEVKIKGLEKNRPDPGLYFGIAHIKDTPLALVIAQLESHDSSEEADEGGTPPPRKAASAAVSEKRKKYSRH
jgi:hypothetical protein